MKEENQITIYETEDGKARVKVRFEDENVWLTQDQMAELFDCSADNISLHLKNIYSEKELDLTATAEEFSVVQKEGQRSVNHNPLYIGGLYNMATLRFGHATRQTFCCGLKDTPSPLRGTGPWQGESLGKQGRMQKPLNKLDRKPPTSCWGFFSRGTKGTGFRISGACPLYRRRVYGG
jgi:hypothetical protein